jgi:periplasmic protein TonB
MEVSPGNVSAPAAPPSKRAPVRQGLVQRQSRARQAARARIVAHVRVAPSPEQLRYDPLAHRRPRARFWPLVGSLLLHGAVVGMGLLSGNTGVDRPERIAQTVRIQRLQEPPPPPLPLPETRAVEPPAPPPIERARPLPRKAKVPDTSPPAAPPRVVGLSLESTVEGGGGPGFAVGNTRIGQTAQQATDAREVVQAEPDELAVKSNAAATRIPGAGVSYVLPKRKQERKPPYPEVLKSQGIEADVTVMLSLDATGKVVRIKIVTPSPYPEFNEAARTAALAEQFEPATRDGVAIPYTLSFTYRFRLEDS